jgi:uncharacterized protein
VKNRAWGKKIAGTLVDAKYKYQPDKSRRSSKLNDLFCINRFYGLSLNSQLMNNKYYILFYKTIDDYVERRKPYREAHLESAQNAFKKGTLILGGAYSDPADGAVLIFKGADQSVAEEFAKNDPYVKNGLVVEWHVRSWTVVIGNE